MLPPSVVAPPERKFKCASGLRVVAGFFSLSFFGEKGIHGGSAKEGKGIVVPDTHDHVRMEVRLLPVLQGLLFLPSASRCFDAIDRTGGRDLLALEHGNISPNGCGKRCFLSCASFFSPKQGLNQGVGHKHTHTHEHDRDVIFHRFVGAPVVLLPSGLSGANE